MTPEQLKKHLPTYADDGMATHILDAHTHTGLALSYCCALVEKESGFRNVFGHDPTRAIPSSWMGTRVTRAKYLYYKSRRKLGYGMQGVGPCQLTWYAFQDQADSLGGCHKPYPNMCVAFKNMKDLIAAHGVERGAAAYNGAGPAADAYGKDFVNKARVWHERLT